MREASSGKIHLLEVRIHFARADEADLEFRRLQRIPPSEGKGRDGQRGQTDNDAAQPEIALRGFLHRAGGQDDEKTMDTLFLDHRLELLLAHPWRPAEARATAIAATTPAFAVVFTAAIALGAIGFCFRERR